MRGRPGLFRPARDRVRACAFWLGYSSFVAVAVTAAAPALALWEDKVTPFVEEQVTRDDNVFRVSKNLKPLGDVYQTASLGLKLDAPLSRQRFQAGYTWSATRFNRLTDLDFDGHDARAIWLWQLGNDLSGQIGYTENLALAPFAYTQSTTPDPLKTRQAFLNGAYLVTPRWRAQAGASGFEQKNGDPALQSNDISIFSTDVSVSYVTPAGTSIGLSGRVEEGRFPNRDFVPGNPFDDSYRQVSRGIIADWIVTGVSRVTARASRVSRRYPNTPQSDFDGYTAVAEYDWKPTGKLSFSGIVRRDISPYQAIQASFVLVKGASLRATLNLTQKIELSGMVDYATWYYLGDPGLVSGGTLGRVDHVGSATAMLSYKPVQSITLQISALREARSSNTVNADYLANVAFFSARIAF
jgi:exopolysaccharide biosynthesis operon protein EpsL